MQIFSDSQNLLPTIDLRTNSFFNSAKASWELQLGDGELEHISKFEKDTLENSEATDLSSGKWIPDFPIQQSILSACREKDLEVCKTWAQFQKTSRSYVWYRTKIQISKEELKSIFKSTDLVIRLGKIGHAEGVYWNGEWIGGTGLEETTPQNAILEDSKLFYDTERYYSIPRESVFTDRENQLAIRVFVKYPFQAGLAHGKFYLASRYYAERSEFWDDTKKLFVLSLAILLSIFYLYWQFIFKSEGYISVLFSGLAMSIALEVFASLREIDSFLSSGVTVAKLNILGWIGIFHFLYPFLVRFIENKNRVLRTIDRVLNYVGILSVIVVLYLGSLNELHQFFLIWIGVQIPSVLYLFYLIYLKRDIPSMDLFFIGFILFLLGISNDLLIYYEASFYPFETSLKDYSFLAILLSVAFSIVRNMVQREKLIEVQKKEKDRLSRYFSPEVLNTIVVDEMKMGGEEKMIVSLFSDIVGFTTYSEKHSPKEVVEKLNLFFERLSDVIFFYKATLDKYIGDAIMAFWGAPESKEEDCYNAISCALDMLKAVQEINSTDPESSAKFQLRIGINFGPTIVGNIGSPKRMDYTVIGDAVNTAARLESSGVPGKVSVSEDAFLKAGGEEKFIVAEKKELLLKGKVKPIIVYVLEGKRS